MHPSQSQYAAIKWETTHPFSRTQFYLRLAAFILLEGGFLALARLALGRPLPVELSVILTSGNSKALFTALFILWHFLATVLLDPIIQHIFASEWQYITRRAGYIFPRADRVSTQVSGFFDYIPHFFGGGCSWAFRFSLIALVISLAIKGLLPGTIFFNSVLLDAPISISVAQLVTGMLHTMSSRELGFRRAAMVVRLEGRENSPFGFDTQQNWVVGWPHIPGGIGHKYPIIYPTDVVYYDFKCHWEAPNFTDFATINNGGLTWTFLDDPNTWDDMYLSQPFLGVVTPVFLDSYQALGSSAFLFFGGNDTVDSGKDMLFRGDSFLRLDGLPTMYNASGFILPPMYGASFNMPIHTTAPLATLLICDPQFRILSGEVTLWPNGTLEIIKSSLNTSQRVGNFFDEEVGYMFQYGNREVFLDYLGLGERIPFNRTMVTYNSAATFLNITLATMFAPPYQQNPSTLPLAEIEANMNTLYRSTAKAFTNGLALSGPEGGTYIFHTIPVNATTQEPAEALTTNIQLFWVAIALVAAEVFSMAALGILQDWRRREPLGLKGVLLEAEKVVFPAETGTRVPALQTL